MGIAVGMRCFCCTAFKLILLMSPRVLEGALWFV